MYSSYTEKVEVQILGVGSFSDSYSDPTEGRNPTGFRSLMLDFLIIVF
jgi:hypothetical protein